jgi:hypothetical protein
MKRRDAGCPFPLALDFLAQRWGVPPWQLEEAPADKVLWYMAVVGIYNEAQADMEGMSEHEAMFWEDDE